MEALLLDPVPFDVYIALRSDAALGSGTQADPWSGGVATSSVLNLNTANITVADNTSDPVFPHFLITVGSTSHPFADQDFVLFNGFTNPDGELLNGTFKITYINIIEILPGIAADSVQPTGIRLFETLKADFDATLNKFFIYRRVLIRNNDICHVDYVPIARNGDSTRDLAMLAMFFENLIVTDNVIYLMLVNGTSIVNPMHAERCKSLTYFNNTDSSGKLIQGKVTLAGAPTSQQQELTTLVQDALILAFI